MAKTVNCFVCPCLRGGVGGAEACLGRRKLGFGFNRLFRSNCERSSLPLVSRSIVLTVRYSTEVSICFYHTKKLDRKINKFLITRSLALLR